MLDSGSRFVGALVSVLVTYGLQAQAVHAQCARAEQARLAPPASGSSVDPAPVAVAGAWAVLGTPENNASNGSAFVYHFNGAGWDLVQTLSSAESNDQFGYSVATDGTVVVVGARAGSGVVPLSGTAYVFRYNGSLFVQEQKLVASDAETGSTFGSGVGVSGNVVLVGDESDSVNGGPGLNRGSAYVFRFNGASWTEEQKLTAADAAAADRFGAAVAIDGDALVIGSVEDNLPGLVDAGSAYVFRYNAGTWVEEQKLTAPDAGAEDYSGYAVDIDGDLVVVGAPGNDEGTTQGAGAVHVFRRSAGTWTYEQKLLAAAFFPGTQLGVSVAATADVILAGAEVGFTSGTVFVYRWTGSTWIQDSRLVASDDPWVYVFGAGADLRGSRAVIWGRTEALGGTPAMYVFDLPAPGDCNNNGILDAVDIADATSQDCGPNCIPDECELADASADDCDLSLILDACEIENGTYRDCNSNSVPDACDIASATSTDFDGDGVPDECPFLASRLNAPDAAVADRFGNAVAMQGDFVAVGEAEDDHINGVDAGSVRVFRRSGNSWTQTAVLTASDAQAGDLFGKAIGIDNDRIVIGADMDSHAGGSAAGSAYVLRREGDNWVEEAHLFAPDSADAEHFGRSVAIDGDRILVGAPDHTHLPPPVFTNGSVYVYSRTGATWSLEAELFSSDTFDSGEFGSAVALDGDVAVVGDWFSPAPGMLRPGAAYVFRRAGTVWTQEQKLVASDAWRGDRFGEAIDISGDWILVGSPAESRSPALRYVGAAYLFHREAGVWIEKQKLVAPDAVGGESFGRAVAIQGLQAVVGASDDDLPGMDRAGSAYGYRWTGSQWSLEAHLIAPDGESSDRFGATIAMDGQFAAIAAPDRNVGAASAGTVYLLSLFAPDCNLNGVFDDEELLADPSMDCQPNSVLDACDIATGVSTDVDLNGIPDECSTPDPILPGNDKCVGGAASGQPCTQASDCSGGSCQLKNRFFSPTLPTYAIAHGLKVALVAIDANSVATPGSYDGTDRWAGASSLNVNDGVSPAFNAAKAQCAFEAQDWSAVGMIHIYGDVIVPQSTYDVSVCSSAAGPCSATLRVDTAKFGDVVTPVNTVNFQDVNSIVAKFQGAPSGPSKTRTKLTNSIVNPANPINFQEVSACVSAFQSKAFKTVVTTPPATCP